MGLNSIAAPSASNNDCYFYYNKSCTKGDACIYRHEPSALGKLIVCSFWQKGMCSRPNCSYRHSDDTFSLFKEQVPCYFESQPGGCKKASCQFLHINSADQSQTEDGLGLSITSPTYRQESPSLERQTHNTLDSFRSGSPNNDSQELDSPPSAIHDFPSHPPVVVHPSDLESDSDEETRSDDKSKPATQQRFMSAQHAEEALLIRKVQQTEGELLGYLFEEEEEAEADREVAQMFVDEVEDVVEDVSHSSCASPTLPSSPMRITYLNSPLKTSPPTASHEKSSDQQQKLSTVKRTMKFGATGHNLSTEHYGHRNSGSRSKPQVNTNNNNESKELLKSQKISVLVSNGVGVKSSSTVRPADNERKSRKGGLASVVLADALGCRRDKSSRDKSSYDKFSESSNNSSHKYCDRNSHSARDSYSNRSSRDNYHDRASRDSLSNRSSRDGHHERSSRDLPDQRFYDSSQTSRRSLDQPPREDINRRLSRESDRSRNGVLYPGSFNHPSFFSSTLRSRDSGSLKPSFDSHNSDRSSHKRKFEETYSEHQYKRRRDEEINRKDVGSRKSSYENSPSRTAPESSLGVIKIKSLEEIRKERADKAGVNHDYSKDNGYNVDSNRGVKRKASSPHSYSSKRVNLNPDADEFVPNRKAHYSTPIATPESNKASLDSRRSSNGSDHRRRKSRASKSEEDVDDLDEIEQRLFYSPSVDVLEESNLDLEEIDEDRLLGL